MKYLFNDGLDSSFWDLLDENYVLVAIFHSFEQSHLPAWFFLAAISINLCGRVLRPLPHYYTNVRYNH